jgi:hypothetical protein
MNEAPLARLKRTGRLDAFELTAADEIIFAYGVSIGSVGPRDSDLGIPATFRPDGADRAAARRVDTVVAYQRWRRELANTPALAAAIAMLLDERGARAVERDEGWRNGSGTAHLVSALRHYAALRGNTPRGARWKLPGARGGALAEAERLARLVPRTVRDYADS